MATSGHSVLQELSFQMEFFNFFLVWGFPFFSKRGLIHGKRTQSINMLIYSRSCFPLTSSSSGNFQEARVLTSAWTVNPLGNGLVFLFLQCQRPLVRQTKDHWAREAENLSCFCQPTFLSAVCGGRGQWTTPTCLDNSQDGAGSSATMFIQWTSS